MIFLQYPIVFLIVVCSRYSLYLTTLGVRNGTFLNCLNLIDSVSYYPPTHTHTHTTPPPHVHTRLGEGLENLGRYALSFTILVISVMCFMSKPGSPLKVDRSSAAVQSWAQGSFTRAPEASILMFSPLVSLSFPREVLPPLGDAVQARAAGFPFSPDPPNPWCLQGLCLLLYHNLAPPFLLHPLPSLSNWASPPFGGL